MPSVNTESNCIGQVTGCEEYFPFPFTSYTQLCVLFLPLNLNLRESVRIQDMGVFLLYLLKDDTVPLIYW